MLPCGKKSLKQSTFDSPMAFYVHVRIYNAAKRMYTCCRLAVSQVSKDEYVDLLHFSIQIFSSTNLDFPGILDCQF